MQESFDQGSIGREVVKWDYELRNFVPLETIVDWALEIAMTEPQGPVYLTLPRQVLAEEQMAFTYTSPSRHHVQSPTYPAPERFKEAAQALSSARSPLIVTQHVGVNPNIVNCLEELAESLAIPVVCPAGLYRHFPSNHPLHLGDVAEPLVREADVILVITADVPWFPALGKPEDTVTVIQMGIVPLGEGAYMFGWLTAAHFVSRAYQLPVLFVIFNNQCWNTVKQATQGIYPNDWAAKTNHWPLTDLRPSPSFERMADVHDGYGELIEDLSKVLPALQ